VLDKIIKFSIQNKFIIGMMTLFLIIFGIYSLKQLPLDALPDITNNQVQIITTAPTLASQEVEQLITYPIRAVGKNHSKSSRIKKYFSFRTIGCYRCFQRRNRYFLGKRTNFSTAKRSRRKYTKICRFASTCTHFNRLGRNLSI
jgi:hypothetical protein